MSDIATDILTELETELGVTESADIAILTSKIFGAIREVKIARNYKNRFNEDFVNSDLENYYSNIKNIATFDYCTIGGEFEKSHDDNGINRTWVDRKTMFNGIVAISEII